MDARQALYFHTDQHTQRFAWTSFVCEKGILEDRTVYVLFLRKRAINQLVGILSNTRHCARQYCCEVRFLKGMNPQSRY